MVERRAHWLAAVLLLLFWLRLQATAVVQAVTFDEILHILHGVLFWQSWQLYGVVQNPPLVNALIGLPVQLVLQPLVPMADAVWQSGDWLRISQHFMWVGNENGLQIIWVGRQAIMLTAVLLGALVYRFAGLVGQRRTAGLLALLLYTFDPNILAHSFLATTDLGTAFFFLLAAFAVWRYWWGGGMGGSWWLAATAVGLVLAAKFSGIIFLIALFLLALYRPQKRLLSAIAWLIAGGLIFLLAYRFQFAPLLDDFSQQQVHQAVGHDAFFRGEVRRGGWWYYFPIIFLIKTPLPTLAFFVLAAGLWLWRRGWREDSSLWLLLLAGGVMAAGLVGRVNIGYRYLLPMLPLLFVFVGQMVGGKGLPAPAQKASYMRPLVYGLLLLLAIASLLIHPYYLAYFNQIAGGPENGWRWAVDSNIDWGQDVQELALYMAAEPVEHFYAAWLGSSPLTAYGLTGGELLPVWPMGREEPLFDAFYPENPAPGLYVLSVTQLQGVYARNPAHFAWFQGREPKARVGYSLFVYEVAATGPAVALGLSGVGLPYIGAADAAVWRSNDVRLRWFDGRSSFLWPGGGDVAEVWTAVGDGHLPTHAWLQGLYPAHGPDLSGEAVVDGEVWRYHLYRWQLSPLSPEVVVAADAVDTAVFGDKLRLLGYDTGGYEGERPLELLTYWRVEQVGSDPLKLFVHLLDESGNLVAQHDGLDVQIPGLQPGDEFAQLHTLWLPDPLPAGSYSLQVGVYNPTTFHRLPLAGSHPPADSFLLWQFAVGQ